MEQTDVEKLYVNKDRNKQEPETPVSNCPNCGYCPHCGRSNTPQIIYIPYYQQPYPWYTNTYFKAGSAITAAQYMYTLEYQSGSPQQ